MTTNVSSTCRSAWIASAVILLGSGILLFARLGHYALWDDEAITAMTARAVWQTGDTSIRVDDHNLLAYRNGLLVRNFKDRYTPPLQFYVIAPFIGLLGESSFVCRLPMAICGLLTVGIILIWLKKVQPPAALWWAAAVLVLSNAEFFLFFRQCRYYGLVTLLSTAAVYLYCTRDRSRVRIIALSLTLAGLLACQYLDYAALVACLAVDYLIWGRRQPIKLGQWIVILTPQLLVGGIVCSIWNPLAHHAGVVAYHSPSILRDRAHLLWWNWRDLFKSDFAILPLVLGCPCLFFWNRSIWLLRAPTALLIFVSAIAMAVPTSVAQANSAEVRYLAPAVALCIAIEILAVYGLFSVSRRTRGLMIGLSIATVLVKPDHRSVLQFDCTPLLYYHELLAPQQESYTPVIDWIHQHVPAGASIFVQPAYKNYPLMFRAGEAVYAWQLEDPPRADFKGVPAIHFFGRVAPDYLIRFGTNSESSRMDDAVNLLAERGIFYEPAATIHLHWRDWYRPELIFRSFTTVRPKQGEEIYIYRKK